MGEGSMKHWRIYLSNEPRKRFGFSWNIQDTFDSTADRVLGKDLQHLLNLWRKNLRVYLKAYEFSLGLLFLRIAKLLSLPMALNIKTAKLDQTAGLSSLVLSPNSGKYHLLYGKCLRNGTCVCDSFLATHSQFLVKKSLRDVLSQRMFNSSWWTFFFRNVSSPLNYLNLATSFFFKASLNILW